MPIIVHLDALNYIDSLPVVSPEDERDLIMVREGEDDMGNTFKTCHNRCMNV